MPMRPAVVWSNVPTNLTALTAVITAITAN
jgi:hypothetical protein